MSIEVPEHLRSGPLAEAAQRALLAAQNMSAASNSIPRVSLRGREFRFIEGGEEKFKFRDTVDVIILGVEPEQSLMIKTFYEKGYVPGAKEPPDCSSDDGIAPAPWVNKKQNPTCRDCPQNKFGSAISPNGKPTKKCRDSKRIWVKLADGNKLGDKIIELPPLNERPLYGINVTVASLKAFADHGRMLQSLGQGPAVCVTELKMLDMEYPQIEFKLKAWLNAEQAPVSLEMADKKPWKVFVNAGLALAAPEDGGTRAALPTNLPGVPAHLQQQAKPAEAEVQGTQTVVDATPAGAKPVDSKSIDDAVGNW